MTFGTQISVMPVVDTLAAGAITPVVSNPGTTAALNQKYDLGAAMRSLGKPPALLSEKMYLTNELTSAEITDIATQAGLLDVSPKLQAMVTAAAGKEVYLPQGGMMRIDTGITYKPTSGPSGQLWPGLKLIGCSSLIKGPANAFAVDIDTGTSFKFLDENIFTDFKIDSANATGSKGIRIARAIRVLAERVDMFNLRGNGWLCEVATNDADSSNRVLLSECYLQGIGGWGFAHEPFAGANDLSVLDINRCLFNACGTDERKLISGITRANPGVVTSTAHGFTNGQRIRFGGIFGMTELNTAYVATVTVINANSYSIGIDTSSFGIYTASPNGGYAFPATPGSGAIKLQTQTGVLRGGGTTEAKNVALYMRGATAPGFQNEVCGAWTAENTTGISILCDGANGLHITGADLRTNAQVAENYAHVLLDATLTSVSGVTIEKTNIIRFEGAPSIVPLAPHTAFQGVGASGGDVTLENNAYSEYAGAYLTRYGSGLFGFTGVKITDAGNRKLFEPGGATGASYTSASPTYTPDLRQGSKHVIVLLGGASGTLTIANPLVGALQSATLNGAPLEIIVFNASGVTINLTWGMPTKGAPSTIANNDVRGGTWRYTQAAGLLQSAGWI